MVENPYKAKNKQVRRLGRVMQV